MLRILYVCEHNACASQLAEGITNLLGDESVEAFSAGFSPASQIDPHAVTVMAELGHDLSNAVPKGLEDIPAVEFDIAVKLGTATFDDVLVKAAMQLDWDVMDGEGMKLAAVRSLRDQLRVKIQRVLNAPLPGKG